MRKGDAQLGTPFVQYKDTQANIEALTGIPEGATAYATDTNKLGSYDGAVWTWGGGGSGGHIIADEGTPLTARATLDFVGAGVTVTDDAGANKTLVTIPGSAAPATTALNDFQVGNGAGAWIKKTLAEIKTILGLGTAAYTASGDYTPIAHATATNNPHSTTAAQVAAIPNDGWIAITATGTSGTLDSPSFQISFNADMTGLIGLGYKIKITQSTTKYFIVTKIGAFSAGATIITCYGGTDYTLVASGTTAITNPYYSPVKAPFGFPLSTEKWTVTVTDTTTRSQASPTAGTWYNLGSVSISAPIGLWRHVTSILPTVDKATAGNLDIYVTLSTANNSQSDATVTRKIAIRTGTYAEVSTIMESILDLTSKTTHYINSKCDAVTIGNIYNNNGAQTLSIKLICGYL
jgi:hypothetical protein